MRIKVFERINGFDYLCLEDIKNKVDELISTYGKDAVMKIENDRRHSFEPTWYISFEREEQEHEKAIRLNRKKENELANRELYKKLHKLYGDLKDL